MNGTLLLVEDEALILMDLEFAAEDAGYDYCAVRSVQAALEALETRDIVAAVLDVTTATSHSVISPWVERHPSIPSTRTS